MKQLQKSTLWVVVGMFVSMVLMASSAQAGFPPRFAVAPKAEVDDNATLPAPPVVSPDDNSSTGVVPVEAPVPTGDDNATVPAGDVPAGNDFCFDVANCLDMCLVKAAPKWDCCKAVHYYGAKMDGTPDEKACRPRKHKPSPAPKNGVDGKDGRGIVSVSINDEGSVVVIFDDGTTHNAGRLPAGHDGRGITSSIIDGGHLIINFTDGTSQDMGRIVGRDGKDGTEARLIPFVGFRTGWDGKALGVGGNVGVEFRFEDLVFEAEVVGLNAPKGSLDRRWSGLVEFRVGLALLDGKMDAMLVGNYGQSSFDPLGGWMRRRWTTGGTVDFRPFSFISSEKYEWWKEVLEVHLQVSGGQQWLPGQTWSKADSTIGVEFGLNLRFPINL